MIDQDRTSHFVRCVCRYKGEAFFNAHNNEIADIIFHAINNWKPGTTSCGMDHNDLAWHTIVQMIKDIEQ